MKAKILYIWDSDYPWDVRVEKICKSLLRHGYEVHIACRNLRNRPFEEIIDGIFIHRLKSYSSKRLNYTLSFPFFFNPLWVDLVKKVVKDHQIDLIIARDLPLCPLGILIAKKYKIPCIFDMAEDYVALVRDIWNDRKWQGFNFIVRNPYLAKLTELYCLKKADHILVVVEEAAEIVKKRGASSQKITIIRNTPDLKLINSALSLKNKKNSLFQYIENKFTAIYVGGIQMGRGIQTVIDAIPKIKDIIQDFLFVIVGDGYAKNYFEKIIKEKGIERYAILCGWVRHKDVYKYISVSKVGLIPHIVTDHTNTTLPNKIFDYMALGIPVIASDSIPMKRIITREKCGLFFKSRDANDLARCLIDLYCLDLINYFGNNGKKAVINKYNWKKDEKKLIKVIEKLL